MSARHAFENLSAVVVSIVVLAAVVGFVAVDAQRVLDRTFEARWLRRWSAAAWPLGVAAIVLAVARVLILV